MSSRNIYLPQYILTLNNRAKNSLFLEGLNINISNDADTI